MKRIDILKEAHYLLKRHGNNGICTTISFLINAYELSCSPNDIFPLLKREYAKPFGADPERPYWWEPGEYGLFSGRRRFMRWLRKQYKNDKEEIELKLKL